MITAGSCWACNTNNTERDGGSRPAFLYNENHSLGEWFKRGYCR